MATWEAQLLTRIINTGDINTALRWGITYEDFLTSEGRAMFQHLFGYFQMPNTSGAVMGPYAIQNMYPNYQLVGDSSMTTEALCHEVRSNRIRTELKQVLQRTGEMIESDPQTALNNLHTGVSYLQMLGTGKRTDVFAEEALGRVLQRYELKEQGVDLSIAKWPWTPLQDATGGLENDDYIIIYGRPKCVPVGTKIVTADGSFKCIEETKTVIGLRHNNRHLTAQKVTGRSTVVKKHVVKITTKTGCEVQVGEDHPILRPDMSYMEAGRLQAGDYIGTARQLRIGVEPGDSNWYELLGLLTGDGNYTRNEVQFTCFDTGVLQRTSLLSQSFHCVVSPREEKRGAYSIKRVKNQRSNEVLNGLRHEGVHGSKSTEKEAPASLFTKDGTCVAAFLGGLLSTDGGIYKNTVRWNTSSKKLSQQIKHLLLRLGIVGSLGEITTNIGTLAYTVNVMAAEQHEKILNLVGPYISSEHKLLQLIKNCEKGKFRKRQNDSIPYSKELEGAILAVRERHGGWSPLWGKFSRNKLFRRSGCISRKLLKMLATGMNAPELLRWADDDIFWDTVVTVEPLGEMDCIDISVSGDHNFLVGDIITHNSMKSWVLAYLIAWFYEQGKRILIYTKEMTADNIYMRVGAVLAGVRYHEFRQAKLSPSEKAAIYDVWKVINHLRQEQPMVCLSGKDTGEGGDTVPWLRSKIELHEPDVCIIDGMYLMTDMRGSPKQKDNARVQNLSRDLRRAVLDTHVPIIATIQANRGAAKHQEANLDEIAFSDAIGQDATLAMRVINEKNQPTLALVVGGSREYELDGFRIYGVPATNFGYAGPLTATELLAAQESDNQEPGAPTKSPKKAAKTKLTNDDLSALEEYTSRAVGNQPKRK